MKTRILLTVLSFVLLLIGCATKPDLEALQSELLQADQDWATAAKAGDIAKLTTYWADDAINFFPGSPPAYGKEAILKLVKRNRSQPGFSLSWEPDKAVVAASGDMGYTYGSFQLASQAADNSALKRNGNYVCIWRKAPGTTWKCVVESSIFNSR